MNVTQGALDLIGDELYGNDQHSLGKDWTWEGTITDTAVGGAAGGINHGLNSAGIETSFGDQNGKGFNSDALAGNLIKNIATAAVRNEIAAAVYGKDYKRQAIHEILESGVLSTTTEGLAQGTIATVDAIGNSEWGQAKGKAIREAYDDYTPQVVQDALAATGELITDIGTQITGISQTPANWMNRGMDKAGDLIADLFEGSEANQVTNQSNLSRQSQQAKAQADVTNSQNQMVQERIRFESMNPENQLAGLNGFGSVVTDQNGLAPRGLNLSGGIYLDDGLSLLAPDDASPYILTDESNFQAEYDFHNLDAGFGVEYEFNLEMHSAEPTAVLNDKTFNFKGDSFGLTNGEILDRPTNSLVESALDWGIGLHESTRDWLNETYEAYPAFAKTEAALALSIGASAVTGAVSTAAAGLKLSADQDYRSEVWAGIKNTASAIKEDLVGFASNAYDAYTSNNHSTLIAGDIVSALTPLGWSKLGKLAPTAPPLPGDAKFIGPTFPETVTAYRVDDLNYPVRVESDGSIPTITTKKGNERALWVNLGQPERAQEFATKIADRGGNPQITAIETDGSLLLKLRQQAVYDKGDAAKLNPNAPLYSDLPNPDQYGLRTSEQIQWFRDAVDPQSVQIIPNRFESNEPSFGLVLNENPTLFGNKFPEHEIDSPKIVPNERLKNVSGQFNYVVKEDGSLVVGKTGHTSLTSGAPVQAAGEIKMINGSVKSVDNASGHFQPVGDTIEIITENAFKNVGIDTSGKYIFKEWVSDPSLPRGGRWAPVKK